MSAAVRTGYKQTDVGLIPEDWEQRTIGDLIAFEGGSQPEKSVFRASPRPGFVRLIQIRDYKTDKFEVFAPVSLLRRFCDEHDIMIGRYGPPVFQILRGLSGAYNVALIKACPRPEIDRNFAYYYLKQDSLFEFIDKLSRRSSGQTGVDLFELRGYPLPLPPLAEQRAIATALSDVDALLSGLDSLIAKKQNLKQAAMQQLLTGQTRLPGFSGEWEVKRLGDVVEIRKGQLITEKTVVFGEIPVIAGGKKPAYFHNQPNRVGKTITVSASGASAGYVALFDQPIFASDCSTISEGQDYSIEFICFQMQLRQDAIYRAQTGGAQPHIHAMDLAPIEIGCPELAEQTAIATVLSDMDTELAALQARRDKTRALKQGMMQELLTGRIRLV